MVLSRQSIGYVWHFLFGLAVSELKTMVFEAVAAILFYIDGSVFLGLRRVNFPLHD